MARCGWVYFCTRLSDTMTCLHRMVNIHVCSMLGKPLSALELLVCGSVIESEQVVIQFAVRQPKKVYILIRAEKFNVFEVILSYMSIEI